MTFTLLPAVDVADGKAVRLVQGEAVTSGRLENFIKSNPDIHIPPDGKVAADVVVLMMSPERAELLKTEFGDELIVEPNADVHFGIGRGGG